MPEIELRDRLDNNTNFEVHAKAEHANPSLPLTFTGHQGDLKARWLQEIAQYANDSLALHEHSVDDLRIDPTQVKPDTEGEALRLPQRKASYESDGIKPSEVAKDHFLTASERESYAKQHAEEQKILLAQQQSFIERKTHVAISTAQQQQQQQQQTTTSITQIAQEKSVAVQKTKAEEKHTKLTRSSAIEKSEEIQEFKKEKQSTCIGTEVKYKNQIEAHSVSAPTKKGSSTSKTVETSRAQVTTTKDPIETGKRSLSDVDDSKSVSTTLRSNIKSIASAVAAAASTNTMSESQSNAELTLVADATPNTNKIHTIEHQLALKSACDAPRDADTANNTQTSNNNKENTAPNSNANSNNPNRASASRYHTVSTYNFGDRQGEPPRGQPPTPPNVNIFLVPPHLITYETSIEINVLKIPAPQPPQPPKFVKKLLVHTESLERKTRAFLSGNFEVGTTDSSLRTARQKIRSLKSTILKSDDEVKHAEDTITKAQSGDFLHIFNPPIIEKPLYEFIEIPSERSEEECSEYSDRRSERGISTEQQHENMEDYYSSKYSSRSSRRRVEGKPIRLVF